MDEQMQWEKILRRAIAAEASDLHVSAHQRVQMRCDGVLCAAEMTPTADFMHVLTASMLSEGQQAVLAAQHDVDFSWQYEGRRFRGNVYRVRDVPALAFRLLPARIRTPGEIGMPASLRALAAAREGLALVCGATGSGKTTTIAALSQAMERRPRVFSPSVVGMVRAGEESGTLDHIFAETAAFLTEAHTLRESMKSALAYPLFLLMATGFSIVLMTMFILPVFASLLRDLGAEPPLPTRLLLQAADVFTTHPYLVPGAAVLLLIGMIALVRVPALRYYLDALLLCVPVLGRFLRFSAWGMILRTLAILMHSGIRLDCAVHLARSVAGNCVLVRSLGRVEERLMQGRTLAYALAQEGQLPQLLQGMLAAGETAGDLERLLRRSADYCKRVSKQLAARIEALAEPIMIVVIGLVIFFGVLSFLLPVFEAMDRMM